MAEGFQLSTEYKWDPRELRRKTHSTAPPTSVALRCLLPMIVLVSLKLYSSLDEGAGLDSLSH